MKHKMIYLIFLLVLSFTFVGCSSNNSNYVKQEQPHLYSKNIECIVTKCDYKYWYASGCHYKAYLAVFNEEYNLEKEFVLDGMDAKKCENLKEGDIINCKMNSWVLDSTGEVLKREINSLN